MKTGFFEGAKFEIERVDTPTEVQVLQRILDYDAEIKASTWAERIRQRIVRLKK